MHHPCFPGNRTTLFQKSCLRRGKCQPLPGARGLWFLRVTRSCPERTASSPAGLSAQTWGAGTPRLGDITGGTALSLIYLCVCVCVCVCVVSNQGRKGRQGPCAVVCQRLALGAPTAVPSVQAGGAPSCPVPGQGSDCPLPRHRELGSSDDQRGRKGVRGRPSPWSRGRVCAAAEGSGH